MYRKAPPEEYSKVVHFLHEIAPQYGFSQTWFDWKYLSNPAGQPHIYFAEDMENKTLAGIYCLMGWEVVCGNKSIKCAQSVDTMVHPAYRNQGVVKELSAFMFEELKKNDVKILFGFPNQRIFPTIMKIGWENFGCMRDHVKVLSANILALKFKRNIPHPIMRVIDYIIYLYDRVMAFKYLKKYTLLETSEFAGFKEQGNIFEDSLRTNRTYDYLDWRYVQKPKPHNTNRIHLCAKAQEKVCWIVSKERNNEIVILDIIPTKQKMIAPALILFSLAMRKEGKQLIHLSCYGPMNKHIRRAGFISRGHGQQIIVYEIDKHSNPFHHKDRWHLMFGDIDAV